MDRIEKLKKVFRRKGVEVVLFCLDSSDLFTYMNNVENKYKAHPASEELRFVLNDLRDNPREGFIGSASAKVKGLFPWSKKEKKILVIAYNEHSFRQKMEKILFIDECYGRAILECYPEIKKKLSISSNPVINMVVFQLFANFFAAANFAFENGNQVIYTLVRERSKRVFQRVLGHDPRYDAFPLFADRLMRYLSKNNSRVVSSPRMLDRLVQDISKITSFNDTKQIVRWRSFCECAQDMVWRGYAPKDVLAASVVGNGSPYFQSIGKVLAKYIGVTPPKREENHYDYNSFASEDENAKRHEKEIRETLGDALDMSFESGDAHIFHEKANAQNQDLLQGKFVGWCAKALQSTADLFDKLRHLGEDSDEEIKQKMRDNFMEEVGADDCDWGRLKAVSDDVVDQLKEGRVVTHNMLIQIANDNDMEGVAKSVEKTTKSGEFQEKIELTNALEQKPEGPAPQTPSLKAAPKVAHAPSAPGMGGGGRGRMRRSTTSSVPKDNASESENSSQDKEDK